MNDEIISNGDMILEVLPERTIITKVEKGSIAEGMGIEVGDRLLSVDDNILEDIIDYYFFTAKSELKLEILKKDGSARTLHINKPEYEPLGISFALPIFTPIRRCRNKCIFCFVDQLPEGFRETLYVKDDDYRLSFLEGSYITLTNLREEDWTRIKRLRLSPLYISIHATSPELRAKMLNNPLAADICGQLKRLANSRIEFHTQVVLCPGINDGEELAKIIGDLSSFWPYAKSVGIVPVGLTEHRRGLYPLQGFTRETAREVVSYVEGCMKDFKERLGYSFVFLADEFYQLADLPYPPALWYEDFPQLENGIGLVSSFEDDFQGAISRVPEGVTLLKRRLSLVTGVAGAPLMRQCVQRIRDISLVDMTLHVVRNRVFGDNITVTGLLTGQDILHGLEGRELGELLLLPSVLLRGDSPLFLDDMTVDELEKALEVPIKVVTGARELIDVVFDLEVRG